MVLSGSPTKAYTSAAHVIRMCLRSHRAASKEASLSSLGQCLPRKILLLPTVVAHVPPSPHINQDAYLSEAISMFSGSLSVVLAQRDQIHTSNFFCTSRHPRKSFHLNTPPCEIPAQSGKGPEPQRCPGRSSIKRGRRWYCRFQCRSHGRCGGKGGEGVEKEYESWGIKCTFVSK